MSSVDTRRAFLFGLTLTELMILFVFLLALLIGKTSADSQELDERIVSMEQSLQEQRLASAEERLAFEGELEAAEKIRKALVSLAPLIDTDPDSPGYLQAVVDLTERFERLTIERNGLAARFEPVTRQLSSADGEDGAALDGLLEAIATQLKSNADPSETLKRLTRSVNTTEELERTKLERDALAARLEPIMGQLSENQDTESALDTLLETVAAEMEASPEVEETLKLLTASIEAREESAECASDLAVASGRLNELQGVLSRADAQKGELDEELQNCRRQVGYQQAKLNDSKGNDKVACWIDERGRRAYLLTVTMTPSGFRTVPSWPTGYEDRAMAIPGVSTLANSTLSVRAFVDAASRVLDWSEQRDCRHTVRVRDSVGSDKDLYKRRLRQIEGSFYKFLMRS